jgi:5-methylcytosine-specific restriction endonuclease McrA
LIQIDFRPPDTSSWRAWRDACRLEQEALDRETGEAMATGKTSPKAKTKVYSQRKQEVDLNLEGPFHGKCAYCESKIYTNQYGDLDHYRPKGAVRDERTGRPVRLDLGTGESNHPGYYWLAYDWQNLLPTCELCNRPSLSRSPGRVGKHDFFPVESFRAIRPGEEAREIPLLLHPVLDDPSEHLGLDPTGVLFEKTKRGRMTIDLLGLNDRDLPNDRRETYERAELLAQNLLALTDRDPSSREIPVLLKRLLELAAGRGSFTMAARLALAQTLGPHRERLPSVLGL